MNDPRTIDWRIYYGSLDPALLAQGAVVCPHCREHAVYDSRTGAPEWAPTVGVMHIVQRDEMPASSPYGVGRNIVSGKHHYWYKAEEKRWSGGDQYGWFIYLSRPGLKVSLFGEAVGSETWRRIYRCAHNDPDFEPKSALKPGEYPGDGASSLDSADETSSQ